jgi:hypothetical protein
MSVLSDHRGVGLLDLVLAVSCSEIKNFQGSTRRVENAGYPTPVSTIQRHGLEALGACHEGLRVSNVQHIRRCLCGNEYTACGECTRTYISCTPTSERDAP